MSAKGGDLLNRTVDNFFPPGSREAERLRNGEDDSEDEDEDGDVKRTPRDDRMDVDEPGSLGRSTRCMVYSVLAGSCLANDLLQHCVTRRLSVYCSNLRSRLARRANPPATRVHLK